MSEKVTLEIERFKRFGDENIFCLRISYITVSMDEIGQINVRIQPKKKKL